MSAAAPLLTKPSSVATLKNVPAVPTIQKVKVNRYVTGKRPDYAPESSSESDQDEEFFHPQGAPAADEEEEFAFTFNSEIKDEIKEEPDLTEQIDDRRLRRIRHHRDDKEDQALDTLDDEDRLQRHQRLQQPEVVHITSSTSAAVPPPEYGSESDDDDQALDDEEIDRRRALMRERAARIEARKDEEELMEVEEEGSDEAASESEEEIEYSDESENEETGLRLKPVFVRKRDRITIQERERQDARERELAAEAKRAADERQRQSRRMVEQTVRKEIEQEQLAQMKNRTGVLAEMGVTLPIPKSIEMSVEQGIMTVVSDDDDEEAEYEAWKLRELRRIKRDRDEREAGIRERDYIERIHNMTDEERRLEFKNNPHIVTNKALKGKYKFLQKYFHRGAFFLDEEDEVYKRDFAQATLEDHFDKTVLPKVMQVKNFGLAGRTKYTHLVDQDTTNFDSPWIADTANNLKFFTGKGGGMKQVFERPSASKKE